MRVKVEIEVSDGSTATVFDESVSEGWQLSKIEEILKATYWLEKVVSSYVGETPEEGKTKAEEVENHE